MKILGVDPGYDRLGLAVVEKTDGQKEVLIHSECFETSAKDDIYSRFKKIGQKISALMTEHAPDALAIENLFITKNQKTAMRVSEARGIIIHEAIRRDIPVFEYSPMQIKTAVTGDGTSDKARMTKMIRLLIKIDGDTGRAPKKTVRDDEYDAIAAALAHIALIHNPVLLQKKSVSAKT